MAMRLSGLMSGMDTESIIKDLVNNRQKKVDKVKKSQTKLEWQGEAWKSLNTKLKNLQAKFLSNMRFSSSYSKKTTKVSNSSAVSVITGENAVNGVQTLSVDKLAKTAYLTGGKLDDAPDGKAWTALSKISDIVGEGFEAGSINVSTGSKSVDINITAETTVSDFLSQVKSAGLNASFDAGSQRFFISAKESGEKNNFSITASSAGGMKALSAMGLQLGLDKDPTSLKQYETFAGYYDPASDDNTIANMRSLIDKDAQSQADALLSQYKSAYSSNQSAIAKKAELEEKYRSNPLGSAESYKTDLDAKNADLEELNNRIYIMQNGAEKGELIAQRDALEAEIKDLNTLYKDASAYEESITTISESQATMDEIAGKINITTTTDDDGNTVFKATAGSDIVSKTEEAYLQKAKYAAEIMDSYNHGGQRSGSATKIDGQDAVITLNGAEFKSTNNTFEINGLTITAHAETKGEDVTVTTQDDTDGIYDMLKNFLKEYNAVINEMDKLYNAESAGSYEPLTDEEKSALSDAEVEKIEKKVKDSLLRHDDNLSSIREAMKSVMSSGIEVNGKTMYLNSFGIDTLGYFVAADNEKNMYHIDGDADDEYTSGNADKLKSMIASDPSTVISFFTKLSQNLYGKMSDMSKSVDGYRSFGSFYDDKKMKSDYTDYTSKISDMEKKLADYEDKWYKKFSKMETAMAKMQSNTNAVTSLLGGGQ